MFGIYSLSIFHFRLSAISEKRNSKVFEDSFGPYLLVFVSLNLFSLVLTVKVFILALILSAVIPSMHVTTQTGTSKYPFVPAHLPYDPAVYEFTAPLTPSIFPYANRTVGLGTIASLLETIALSVENQFTIKETKKSRLDKELAVSSK